VRQSCSIVIGAGFGDEGKGHYVDILCNRPNTLNIRFNGGAQASHTVVTPDGRRYPFSSVGAGTFTGAATYLSAYYLVNPVYFVLECDELKKNFGIAPRVFVNREAPVTTLFDVYINQAIEEYRAKERHGSVGKGIWETVERTKNPLYELRVKDLLLEKPLREKLKKIRDEYVPKRLKEEYGVELSDLHGFSEDYPTLLSSDETIDLFTWYVGAFLSLIEIKDDSIINCFNNLVFEGAQGLGLDENNPDISEDFLTPSTTGVRNAMSLLTNAGYKGRPDIYFLSRTYATRHGNGPLDYEVTNNLYKRVEDKSNKENKFQGKLRLAYIDFAELAKRISRELPKITLPSNINLGFTCLDQLDEPFGVGTKEGVITHQSGEFINKAKEFFVNSLPCVTGFSGTYGLTRDEFVEFY
jgi:adenylosuccinate synthase